MARKRTAPVWYRRRVSETVGQGQLGAERSKGGAAGSGGGLTLERYATLRAEIDAGVPQLEVLDREKVSEAEWLAAQAFWMKSMADEARRNKFGATIRYQAIYGAKKKNFENRLERNRAKKERAPLEPPPVAALAGAGAVLAAPLAADIPARAFPQPPPAPARAPWSPPPPAAPPSAVPLPTPFPAPVAHPPPAHVAPGPAQPLMSFHEEPSFSPQTARDVSPFGAAIAEPARVGGMASPGAVARPAAVEAPVSLPPNTQPPLTQPPATQPDPKPRRHHATVSIDMNSPEAQEARRAAMPFQAASSATPGSAPPKDAISSHPPPTSAFERRRDLGSTWSSSSAPPSSATMPFQKAPVSGEVKPASAVAPSAGLPFQRQGGSSPAFPAVVPPAPGQSETTPLDLSADAQRQLREALALAKPAKQNLGATVTALDGVKGLRDATPFKSAPPTSPAPPAPAFAPTAPAPAPAAATPDDDDDDDVPRTKMLDPSVVAKAVAAATPFGPTPAPQAVGQHGESPRTTALDMSQLKLGGTPFQAASTPAGGAQSRQTPPPFSAVAPQAVAPPGAIPPPPPSTRSLARARFTINVFASLTAEIAENPGEIEAIRARYGISEAEHHEESQRWTEEFQKNEDLRARYLGIVQRYRGYVQQRKR